MKEMAGSNTLRCHKIPYYNTATFSGVSFKGMFVHEKVLCLLLIAVFQATSRIKELKHSIHDLLWSAMEMDVWAGSLNFS